MIYTVTLNPSIDYVISIDGEVQLGTLNRMTKDKKFPGGKGINVSRILARRAIPNVALGFVGGFTGQFIEEWLHEEEVLTKFTRVKEDTRINVKVKAETETEINGQGPHISTQVAEQFLEQFTHLGQEDTVILAGSKPSSLPEDYYQTLIQSLKQVGCQFVMDTTGEELRRSLTHGPLVVKPNIHELEELFDVSLNTIDGIIQYGKKLIEEGSQYAIISMGGEGSILFTQKDVYQGNVPKGTLKNSVGAGDSMIAGFVGTYQQTKDPVEAFKIGIACGSATAFEEDLATKDQIDQLIPEIKVEKIK